MPRCWPPTSTATPRRSPSSSAATTTGCGRWPCAPPATRRTPRTRCRTRRLGLPNAGLVPRRGGRDDLAAPHRGQRLPRPAAPPGRGPRSRSPDGDAETGSSRRCATPATTSTASSAVRDRQGARRAAVDQRRPLVLVDVEGSLGGGRRPGARRRRGHRQEPVLARSGAPRRPLRGRAPASPPSTPGRTARSRADRGRRTAGRSGPAHPAASGPRRQAGGDHRAPTATTTARPRRDPRSDCRGPGCWPGCPPTTRRCPRVAARLDAVLAGELAGPAPAAGVDAAGAARRSPRRRCPQTGPAPRADQRVRRLPAPRSGAAAVGALPWSPGSPRPRWSCSAASARGLQRGSTTHPPPASRRGRRRRPGAAAAGPLTQLRARLHQREPRAHRRAGARRPRRARPPTVAAPPSGQRRVPATPAPPRAAVGLLTGRRRPSQRACVSALTGCARPPQLVVDTGDLRGQAGLVVVLPTSDDPERRRLGRRAHLQRRRGRRRNPDVAHVAR